MGPVGKGWGWYRKCGGCVGLVGVVWGRQRRYGAGGGNVGPVGGWWGSVEPMSDRGGVWEPAVVTEVMWRLAGRVDVV